MTDFLTDLALGHQRHEGYGSLGAFRITAYNNPGALRWNPAQAVFGGRPGDGFTVFPSYASGFAALKADLLAKLTGKSAHIDYGKNPTFQDYVKIYAPSDDGNDPHGYCQALIRQLQQYHLSPDTPLTHLAALATAQPVPQLPPLSRQLATALRAAGRVQGQRLVLLLRKIARLRKRIDGTNEQA